MNLKKDILALVAIMAGAMSANAQLSTNPDKFLGNITTAYNVDYGSEKFRTLWNQITCENESKWASIEGTNNSFNWSGSDRAYNYAQSYKFPFKFHALIWGAQYPSWIEKLTPELRYNEIVQWMDNVKAHYPNLELIDVVNEAITGHQAGTPYFIEALGGTGKTGYDWIIKAFELAYERWPNAILIYNDFNTFQWNTDQYIDLVKTLRDAGAPIDAYGCQSHDLTDCSLTKFKQSMTKIQNALKMPMYSTEYDIGTADDALQLQRYKEQIPYMWEADYVAGVTLWGYIYGKTWTTDGNSGIIKDGKDRPAMTWLREYMKSDAAKNAKSPFPGMKKEASVYVQPEALVMEKGKEMKINVRAKMRTKTIEKVDLYVKNELASTMTAEPYETTVNPAATGTYELKAVVTCTDGSTYQRYSEIVVANPRTPFKNSPAVLPGKVEAENFDCGPEGISFHDTNSNKEGTGASYRTDITGIDVEKGGTGYTIGYTQVGEWMEYTVDVEKDGYYSYDIYYSAPNDANISLALSDNGTLTQLTDIKQTIIKSSNWNTFRHSYGRCLIPLKAGKQVIRLSITGSPDTYVTNIDYITFTHVEVNDDIKVSVTTDTDDVTVGDRVTITTDVESPTTIKNVKFYNKGNLIKTVTSAPYQATVTPSVKGDYTYQVIVTDNDGKQSQVSSLTFTVSPQRKPYQSVVSLPGIIEAENFDRGEEGFTFHDSDNEDSGNCGYRTDNEGVDIRKASNGEYVIGWTNINEWYEYSVNVPEQGLYSCEATVASGTTGSGFKVGVVQSSGTVKNLWSFSVAKTGDNTWENFKVQKATGNKELSSGNQILRITITGSNCDIDKLNIKLVQATGIEELEATQDKENIRTYNICGQPVGKNYKGIVIRNGKRYLQR